jgi:hypothetical protein
MSFQKLYFATKAVMAFGSLASTKTLPPRPARFATNACIVSPFSSSGFHLLNAARSDATLQSSGQRKDPQCGLYVPACIS